MNISNGYMVTVNRYGPSDKYGHRPPPTTHTIGPCAIAPAGSPEYTGDQQLVLTNDTVYCGDINADVKPTDEIVVPDGAPIDAGVYQVNGGIRRWSNPMTGSAAGCDFSLERAS